MNLKSDSKKLVLIDVHALVHRAYHAYPPTLSVNGVQTNAAYGFSVLMLEVLEKFHPEYVMCAVDIGKPTRRIEIYPEYKATRKPTDKELIDQLPIVHEIIDAFGIPIYKAKGYEADDLIGSIVSMKNIENKPDLETIIVTGDKDLFQLVDKNTYVYMSGSAFSGAKLYGSSEVKEKMGFGPELVIDYKALRGDASDNIPGVPGIGEKSAKYLIAEFGHLDNVYKNLNKIDKNRIKNALEKGVESSQLSKQLATIETDIKVDFDLEKSKPNLDSANIMAVLQKYRFHSLVKRVQKLNGELIGGNKISNENNAGNSQNPENTQSSQNFQQSLFLYPDAQNAAKSGQITDKTDKVDYEVIDKSSAESFIQDLAKQKMFAFDTETDSLDFMNCKVVGMSFSFKAGEAFFIPAKSWENDPALKNSLAEIFFNPKIQKIGHNIKFDIHVLKNAGFEVKGVYFDTMLAAYILQMGEGTVGLKSLALKFFGMQMLEFKELLKLAEVKGQIGSIPPEKLGNYACADADATFRLYEELSKLIEVQPKFKLLFHNIEMPLIGVLIGMERNGISLDTKFLQKLAASFDKQILELKDKILDMAGVQFNINSPKQLGEVLYQKLHLSSLKKTSSGAPSTNERVLREIRDKHEIIDLILSYRELSKLRSTYTDALIAQVDEKTGRVHSSFNQAVASTGRLSSSDPNLQNIPVASELGNKIRKSFIPQEGKIFVSFDYSQQELRILAGVSRDEELLRSYKQDVDVHKLTASKLFNIEMNKVIKQQRDMAKTVNFSIIYGISAFGLADRMKIQRERAQDFIKKYFELYPGVKKFFHDLVDEAKERGFVESKYRRRRDASGLRASNFRVRSAIEREIINFPIQGGAADMVKRAMIAIATELEKSEWKNYKMLLQVHDELVFEVPENEKQSLKKFINFVRKAMLEANTYDVPMKVDVGLGKNWGNIEEYGLF